MRKQYILAFFFVLHISTSFAQSNFPSDKNATKETIHLYQNLKNSSLRGFLFGHQDDLAYGIHWKYQKDSSDVKSITGDYPGLFGCDLSGLESDHDKDIDGNPFSLVKSCVEWAYAKGGVITFSWHSPSPLGNGKTAWDTTHGTVESILPGGINHVLYQTWLDKVAAFLNSLKGAHGEAIPILYRPFHEFSGNWFWWCANTCSTADFKKLWRYQIHYLRDIKHLHNLLIVYNPSDNFKDANGFLERYPGDDVVDVLSLDSYQSADAATSDVFEKNLDNCLSVIEKIAGDKGKLFALAETGYERIPYKTWWTEKLMKGINQHKIAYLLVWRNAGEIGTPEHPHIHYYVPFKGDMSAEDFVKFYKQKNTFFLKDAAKENLYK
ncbi:beta-mannosidase [Arachidicoccus ginsenosidimutans]|uniref:glycoside hydrolase family 26 protein n=1 Tax=Arachidicoccus sp. BS20 TaxID=1850526 RepID=UPI0007F0E4CF|nr:glycosyl hydrolase [Arachidicoccus sp. BS20]ANI90263.1 beta-mannosidase [Arachidicoccus sp. BS20]